MATTTTEKKRISNALKSNMKVTPITYTKVTMTIIFATHFFSLSKGTITKPKHSGFFFNLSCLISNHVLVFFVVVVEWLAAAGKCDLSIGNPCLLICNRFDFFSATHVIHGNER